MLKRLLNSFLHFVMCSFKGHDKVTIKKSNSKLLAHKDTKKPITLYVDKCLRCNKEFYRTDIT
jgi:hypothetical protein